MVARPEGAGAASIAAVLCFRRRPGRLSADGCRTGADHIARIGCAVASRCASGNRRAAIRQSGVLETPAHAVAGVALTMSTILEAFRLVMQTDVLLAILLASIYGLVVGSLPGLSAT